jgi:MBG domain (YGX type)
VTLLAGAPTAAGAYTVVAHYASDNPNYTDADSSAVSFTIAQATPTITWGMPADITYGTALGPAQLDASASVPGNFAYTFAAGTILNAGPGQTLSATFTPADSANFFPVTAATIINVAPAPLTIAVGVFSRYAGQPNPAFAASYSGFVLGQGPGALNGTLTLSTPANAASPAGVYPVVPGRLSSPNYAITYVNGSLVVSPALVTVQSVQWQTRKVSRTKSVRVLAITFSGPLNQATALNLQAYDLAAHTTKKKHVTVYNKVIRLVSPLYDPLTNTVTLQPKSGVPKQPLQLTIIGSLILDAQSRQLDLDSNGQPGGNYVTMIHG